MDWRQVKRRVRTTFRDVPSITTAELATWLADPGQTPPLLLDARAPEEFAISHLRHAQLATDVRTAAAQLRDLPASQTVVAYCSVGFRSGKLVHGLLAEGVSRVFNLEGSLFQWANEQRPLYRGETQVCEVHPYDHKWGQLLDSRFHAPPR